MDSIDKSYQIFNYEGGISTEMKDVVIETVTNSPMVLTDENLKLFKSTFIIEKLVEGLKNPQSLKGNEILNKVDEIFKKKIEDINEPLLKVQEGVFKFNLNQLYDSIHRSITFLENIKLSDVQLAVSGNIVPALGTYYFYNKISNIYASQLEKNLNNLPLKYKLTQIKIIYII